MSSPLDELKPRTPAASGSSGPQGTPPSAPITPEDAGSQALAEALRSSFAIVRIIMVILVVVFFASGIFTVRSQEKAIVLRFGRPVGTPEQQLLGPGLHWSFPYPIDEVVHIPISQVQTVTSTTGWYATTPEAEAAGNEPEPGGSLNPASDGYTLTSDGNIIHIRMALRYRINNPLDYVLNFVSASNVVQNALDSAIIHASTQFTVDQALRLEFVALRERILANVRQRVDQQGLGISIDNDPFLVVMPPRQVKKAFADVIAADQDRGKTVSEAQGYASSVRNRAAGDAQIVVNEGKTEADRLLQSVAADAQYFQDQLPHYQSNPELFLARLQTETLQRILTNAQDKILRMDDGARPMWIQLNREPPKPVEKKQAQGLGQPSPTR
jgi:membrane protease subunit HflK